MDDRGEVILGRGVCSKCGVASEAFWVYTFVSLLTLFLFMPLSIIFGIKAVKAWKLYFTKSGIYHVRTNGVGCCYNKWFIPMHDIEEVYVATRSTIWVQLTDPSKVLDYIHWCNRPLCGQKLTCLVLSNVANAPEFVAAVKQQLASR